MGEKLEKAGRALVEAWCRTQSLPPIEFAPDELDALVTAVLTATPDRSDDALAEERAWQPIETAPRDGSSFLGWSEDLGARSMWWDRTFQAGDWDEERDEMTWRAAWNAGRVGSWEYQEYQEEFPTHWMPFPKAPRAALKGEGL